MSEPTADTSIPTGSGYCPACGAWKTDLLSGPSGQEKAPLAEVGP